MTSLPLNLFGEQPPGDIGDVRKEKYLEKGFTTRASQLQCAQSILEILATLGILGLAVFLMLLFYPLVKKETDTLYAPFLIICLITFCTESLLLRQQGILFYVLLFRLYAFRTAEYLQEENNNT